MKKNNCPFERNAKVTIRQGWIIFPVAFLISPVWAQTIIATPQTSNGPYNMSGDVTITSTGSLTIDSPRNSSIINTSGTLTVDGGTVTAVGVNKDAFFGRGGGAWGFNVVNGGKATLGNVGLAAGPGAQGAALIDGPNSQVTATRVSIGFGTDASATLTLSNGGRLSSTELLIGRTGAGVLNIGAGEGALAKAPGFVSGPIYFGLAGAGVGSGIIVFNHTSQDYIFSSQIHSTTSDGTVKVLAGVTRLTGNNTGYRGQIAVEGGTLIGSTSSLGTGQIANNSLVVLDQGQDGVLQNLISGSGALEKMGVGTATLAAANIYTGGTAINAGTLALSGNGSLAASGALNLAGAGAKFDISQASTNQTVGALRGVSGSTVDLGARTLSFGDASDRSFAGAINGTGGLIKQGSGTQTLSGANLYSGATHVAQGTLKAGAANTFSASSVHSVAAGATLDLAGFNQSVASLTNSGAISLVGTTPGTTLTVNGNYSGNDGVLKLGTVLNDIGPSDRLVINGGTATGHTSIQIANLGGLGALTSGDGIEVISARNGTTTTAQTTKDAFSLAGGHVDAGAYEYRLYAADTNGAGENWYLRSHSETPGGPPGVPMYRAEASLYAALPSQLRQGDLAMLGDLRRRVGDEDLTGPAAAPTGPGHRSWARVLSTDIDIRQGGAVSPASKGRLNGFQAGTDLLATANWRGGVYVGQLDGDASVNGFASGVSNLRTGRNDLRSQYVGVYGTYTSHSGFYADAVVQSGRHRYTVQQNLSGGVEGKGGSLLGSIEIGQSFPIGVGGWSVEPQMQLIHQHLDLGNSAILGAVVQPQADSGWIARAGVRIKGETDTGIGKLQPYVRFNVYKTSSGVDIARFVSGATVTDIPAPTGGTSTELASGFTLALGPLTSLYGEIGKLWSSGGKAKIRSSVNGSLGIRVKW